MNKLISVKNLRKSFGFFKPNLVLEDINFDVYAGDSFGISGANGAGKTVLLHILLGIVLPDSGEIKIFGKDLFKNLKFIRSKINYASPYDSLFQQATLMDNLTTFANLYGIDDKKRKIEEILSILNLKDHATNQLLESFSDGMRAKAILSKALINDAEILLLDEPFASLDFQSKKSFSEYLLYSNKKEKKTIIITSHNFEDIKNFCNRMIFLDKGKIIFEGKVEDIPKKLLS